MPTIQAPGERPDIQQQALASQPLHPETARLLEYTKWTSDPAVRALFEAIETLIPIGHALRELSANRPAINRAAGSEVGGLQSQPRETGRINVWDHKLVPSGVIGLIWEELTALRHSWINARLTAEGLRADVGDQNAWFDRYAELQNDAGSVSNAYALFQQGAL